MLPALVAFCLLSGDLGAPTGAVSEVDSQGTPFVPGIFAFQASVTSESRAGEAPLIAGSVPQAFVAELLLPRLDIQLRNPGLIFTAWYGPRILWEDPQPSSNSGPLVLHTFGLSLDTRPTRDTAMEVSASGAIGEPDYTTLPQVLGTVQGTLPPVVELATAEGLLRVAHALSERWGLGFVGRASHWQWLDIPPPPAVTASTVTSSTALVGEPAVAFRPTLLDTVGLGAALGWVTYSTGVGAITVIPAVTSRSRLDRRVELNLRLGLSYARLVGTPIPPPGTLPLLGNGSTAFSPIGSAEILLHLARRDEILFEGRAFAGVDYYLDPILGVGLPRALAAAELTAVSVPNWTTSLRGDFATALQNVPVVPGELPPDETAFSLSLSVRRRVTPNFYAELGGRWADRGPTLNTPDFQFHQRQIWVYLSLIGTTRPIPRTGLPKE